MGRSHLDFSAGSTTGRADEDDSGMGLGSGTVHITGLVKHSFVRLAQLVSHIWPTGLWGINVQLIPLPLLGFTRYDNTACDRICPGNAHDTVDETLPTRSTTE